MALCHLTVLDFTDAVGRFDEGGLERYDLYDLVAGADYARDLMSAGYMVEPLDGFDLLSYAEWCDRRAAEIRRGLP